MAIYKPEKWLQVTSVCPGEPLAMQVLGALKIFHAAENTTTALNKVNEQVTRNARTPEAHAALKTLESLTGIWLKKDNKDHPLYGPFRMLHLSVKRRLGLLAAAPKARKDHNLGPAVPVDEHHWGQVAARAQGSAGTAADMGRPLAKWHNNPGDNVLQMGFGASEFTGDAKRDIAYLGTGQHNYWLERADPLHRPWGHAAGAEKIFSHWFNSGYDYDFFTYIENFKDQLLQRYGTGGDWEDPQMVHLLKMDRGVKYVEKEDLWRYRVQFEDAKLKIREKRPDKATALWKDFDTTQMRTVTFGDGWAIWVHRPAAPSLGTTEPDPHEGKIYTHGHKADRFHHSSFLQGADVIAAGEWVVLKGNLVMICNKTGHYKAGLRNVANTLNLLKGKGVNITTAVCLEVVPANGTTMLRYYYAAAVAEKGDAAEMVREFDAKKGDDTVRGRLVQQIASGQAWSMGDHPLNLRKATKGGREATLPKPPPIRLI